MIYPFTHTILGHIKDLEFKFTTEQVWTVWDDWTLQPISCPALEGWISQSMDDMIYNSVQISAGTECDFHIDRFESHMIKHRILVPLSDNFVWQWKFKNGRIEELTPTINTIYLFNNMIPHRFVGTTRREVIYVDIWDKKLNDHMKYFTGNFTHVNTELSKI